MGFAIANLLMLIIQLSMAAIQKKNTFFESAGSSLIVGSSINGELQFVVDAILE